MDKHPVFVIHVEHPLLSTYDIITYRDAVPEHKGVSICLHVADDILKAFHRFIQNWKKQSAC